MHASREKPIAFNKRILENEDEIAAVNPGMSGCLTGLDFMKPVCVAIGVGQRMIDTPPICGQLRIQENRSMTVTNRALPETGTLKDAVALAERQEALQWKHVLELNQGIGGPNRE
jgi:hypothetical protein